MRKTTPSNYADTFLSKLKEQSFTIILLVGIMYYQNTLFTGQMNEYKTMIKAKEDLILKLTEEERQRLIERERYLISQRDEFIKELKEKIMLAEAMDFAFDEDGHSKSWRKAVIEKYYLEKYYQTK